MTAGYASSTDAWKRNHPAEERDVVAELRAENERLRSQNRVLLDQVRRGRPSDRAEKAEADLAAARAEVADLRDRLAAVQAVREKWENTRFYEVAAMQLRNSFTRDLHAALGDADTLAEVRARAWDEGHNDTDEHGDGNCECPNPYRADRNEGATDE